MACFCLSKKYDIIYLVAVVKSCFYYFMQGLGECRIDIIKSPYLLCPGHVVVEDMELYHVKVSYPAAVPHKPTSTCPTSEKTILGR